MTEQTTPITEELTELFGDKEVRWYQVAARNGVEEALEQDATARILIVLPTGAGKTITSGLVFSSQRVRAALGLKEGETLRLLFIAHKHRLLSQANWHMLQQRVWNSFRIALSLTFRLNCWNKAGTSHVSMRLTTKPCRPSNITSTSWVTSRSSV